jgi:hypothetical protein
MNYEEELARLSDAQLDAMASEPETAFPPELWKALTHLRALRAMSPVQREAFDRERLPKEEMPDVSSWTAVMTVARTSSRTAEAIWDAIARMVASDPLYKSLGQPGYPNDLYVSFPVEIGTDAHPNRGTENMWVRTVHLAPEPNHWIGRLLNEPKLFALARRDDYVEFVATNRGLFFVRVHVPAEWHDLKR